MIKVIIFDVAGVLLTLDSFLNDKKELLKENIEIVKKLRKNYKLGILSNSTMQNIEGVVEENFKELFDVIIVSGDVGFQKPQKEIYEIALKKFAVTPKEVVFIDDIFINVSVARSIGINGILYIDSKKLKKDLFDLGVKF